MIHLEGKLFIFNPNFQHILSKNNGVASERPSNTIIVKSKISDW